MEKKIYSKEIICNIHCNESDETKLNDLMYIKDICIKALKDAKCELVENGDRWYQFGPKDNTEHDYGGITGVVILQESHFHISTWPEDNYFQLNINTCGDTARPMKALHEILRNFNIENYTFDTLNRS